MNNYPWFHVLISVLLAGAVGVGSILGTRAAAKDIDDAPSNNSSTLLARAADPRHPIEIYQAPLFLKTQDQVLSALRITTVKEDKISLNPGFEFGAGGELTIERALPITVRDAGDDSVYHTWVNSVGELLAERGIEIGDRDRVEPTQDFQLDLGTVIKITRVSVTEVSKNEVVNFKTKTIDDADRPRGERIVSQKGTNGQKKLTYEVTRENGKEVGRKLIKTEVTIEPIEEIISIGTRVVVLGQGTATWYDPPWSGLTAAHNSLPKGTLVDVVNVRNGKRITVKINDRGIQGGAIIDLSVEAFKELGLLSAGVIAVRLEIAG